MTLIPSLTFTDYEWFPWSICNGCGMPAGNAYPSRHLVPSPILGLANAPIIETEFLELAMSLLDFSPRIPLGTFSILLNMSKQVFFRRMDRGLVEHFDEAAINLWIYGVLCIFRIQYLNGTSSSSLLVSNPNEVRTDLWPSLVILCSMKYNRHLKSVAKHNAEIVWSKMR